jgi:hypothetical protein
MNVVKPLVLIAAALTLAGCVGTMPEPPYDAVADSKNDPPPAPEKPSCLAGASLG